MFIRGLSPAEHEYVKAIVAETCYSEGWIVAQEVLIPPKAHRVDVIAMKNGKLRLFEVTTPEDTTKRTKLRCEYLKPLGKICFLHYQTGQSPDRNAIEIRVKLFLYSEVG